MRRFVLSALVAVALVGSLAVNSADAQWRRWQSSYYYPPAYTPAYAPAYTSYYYDQGNVTYYPSGTYSYSSPTYYYSSPGYTSYYYAPTTSYQYTTPSYPTYYGPMYYDWGSRRWR